MIFVTGATGLLGSHLLGHLLCSGRCGIYALRRESSRMKNTREIVGQYAVPESAWKGIQWIEGDILDQEILESVISKVDTVYHCAAVVSFSGADKERLLDINLKGTENIARLCLKYHVRLCYVSSIAALGDAHYEGEMIDETTPEIEGREHSVYSQSKMAAERIVREYVRNGLNVVIVNPSIILGPGHWGKSSSQLFLTVEGGMPFYTGGICGYVDVRDVCRLMIRLTEDEKVCGERFVLNGGNYSYKELFTAMALSIDRRPPHICMKPWMTSVAWRIMKVAGKIRGKQASFTRETARSSHNRSYYSSAKILDLYPDFRYRSLEDTVKHMAEQRRLSFV